MRTLFLQPKPAPNWYPQELADQRKALLTSLIWSGEKPLVTSGDLWQTFEAEVGKRFDLWPDWLANKQRPAHRFDLVVLDEPWIGKATMQVVTEFLKAGVKVILFGFRPTAPTDEVQFLQPEGALSWLKFAPLGDVNTEFWELGAPAQWNIRGIAHPAVLCSCWDCKKAREAGAKGNHGWLKAGSLVTDGPRAKKGQPSNPQRPFEGALGGYCLIVDKEHGKAVESWRPPEEIDEEIEELEDFRHPDDEESPGGWDE